jgi:hypothetical protein
VVGGGSQNKLWRRVLADAFQLPLRFPAEPEAAALGAALQVCCRCLCPTFLCAPGVCVPVLCRALCTRGYPETCG